MNSNLLKRDMDYELEKGKSPRGGNETILLVDDEAFIRDLGNVLFTEYGYKVITADDGESALKLYCQNIKRIDLILLDMNMPGINGKQSLKEILQINPQAKIIVVSSDTHATTKKEVLNEGANHFISKPFMVDQILNIVRIVLDEKNIMRSEISANLEKDNSALMIRNNRRKEEAYEY